MWKIGLVFALLTGSAPAIAKVQFAPFDGPSNVQHGSGGSKETYHGVEYWRTGTPARQYRVLGFVFDQRREEGDGLDDSLKSDRLAKLIKKHGGDAAIYRGSEVTSSNLFETHRQIEYLIIKYAD